MKPNYIELELGIGGDNNRPVFIYGGFKGETFLYCKSACTVEYKLIH